MPDSNFDLAYALEKFNTAEFHLATSFETLRERLALAYDDVRRLDVEGAPVEIRSDLEWIHQSLTAHQRPDGQRIPADTLRHMRKEKAVEVAHRFVRIRDRLDRLVQLQRDSNAASSGGLS